MLGDEILSERRLRELAESAEGYQEGTLEELDMGSEKRCKRCGLPKPPKDFHRNRYGITGTCKECFSASLRGPRKKDGKAKPAPTPTSAPETPDPKKSRIEKLQARGFRVIVKTIICCPHCEALVRELKD